jgi:hypothetical protein
MMIALLGRWKDRLAQRVGQTVAELSSSRVWRLAR